MTFSILRITCDMEKQSIKIINDQFALTCIILLTKIPNEYNFKYEHCINNNIMHNRNKNLKSVHILTFKSAQQFKHANE